MTFLRRFVISIALLALGACGTGGDAGGTGGDGGGSGTGGVGTGGSGTGGDGTGGTGTGGVGGGGVGGGGVGGGGSGGAGGTGGSGGSGGSGGTGGEGALEGAACQSADDCRSDTCLFNSPGGTPLPGGYCTQADCTATGECPPGSLCYEWSDDVSYCLDVCVDQTQCRTMEGYVCDSDHTCWPGQPTDVPVGGVCWDHEDCAGDGYCYRDGQCDPNGWINGYCMIFDCTASSCPDGSSCYSTGSSYVCLASCTNHYDCRTSDGYRCVGGTCWPGCSFPSACPGGYFCNGDVCVSEDSLCTADNPFGECTDGDTCVAGVCVSDYAFACDDNTWLEPNETRAAAGAVVPATAQGTQSCTGDSDWYEIEIPAGHIGTFGIQHDLELIDLDLSIYDDTGAFVDNRIGSTTYSYRDFETNEEYQSGIAGSGGPRTFYLEVKGASSFVAGDYGVFYDTHEYTDGALCTDHYPADECAGQGNGELSILEFPHPDPNDAVGDLYMFDSVANYRFARRELIMLVRHAIKTTADQFPGTNPLGLIDICQRDGITPGCDVADLRHPETTHDQGGNIDIAYYQTLSDNHARVVCNASGTATDGYFCTSSDNHIVDLPRTAFFLGKLAEHPRFRVAGIDKLIAPLLRTEIQTQRDAGTITQAAAGTLLGGGMAYGDGWPFHHHHIHLSMDWWSFGFANPVEYQPPIGCGYRMPGDGEWLW